MVILAEGCTPGYGISAFQAFIGGWVAKGSAFGGKLVLDLLSVGCLKVRLRRMTFIGVALASATLWGWRWEMGILAEGGAPGCGILAFAYGDLKIQAFCENCGFGLIACGGVGIPFLGIAWLVRL